MVAEVYLTEDGGSRRLFSAIAGGALTSFALAWIMQSLVHVDIKILPPSPPFTVDFVRVIRDISPPEAVRPKPIRETLEPPPVPPPFNPTDSIDPRAVFVDVAPSIVLIIDPDAGKGSSTRSGDDRNAVPILRIEPNYPPRALQQGIEGYVDLSFTITSVGTTSNVEVTRSVPPYVFDREAVRAVRRWRYNPNLAQSSGIARPSESVRLEFELPRQGRR